jgi:hypothetical protein
VKVPVFLPLSPDKIMLLEVLFVQVHICCVFEVAWWEHIAINPDGQSLIDVPLPTTILE